MSKKTKEIKVIITGTPALENIKNYHIHFAIAIINKYGIAGAKKIIDNLTLEKTA